MRVKIKDICKIISGGDRPSIVCDTQTDECNIPIYGNALDKEGLYGFTNYPVVNEEAVTIAARGSNCGISFLRETPFVPIVRLLTLIPNREKILPKYLYYVIKNQNFKSTGSGQPQITIPQISEYEMDIIEEINKQKNISTILYAIDKKIKLNNKINSELENMAKTVYDYWFLQFEFPNDEGKPYKSSGGKMVWNEELKKEIPNGWEVTQIDSVLSAVPSTRKKLKKEYLSRGKHPVIDQSSVYISGFTDDEKAVLFLKDAVVFGDHTKIIKYINFDFCRGADGTQILLSNRENLPNILLYHQVKNLNLVSQGYSRYFKFLKEKQIVLPNFEIAKQFKITSEKLYQKIRSNIFENQELTSLRDYLLPLLMNGQVGFKD